MIIWTAVAMAVVLGWMWAANYVQRKWPAPPPVAQTEPSATQPSATQPSFAASQPTSGPAASISAAPTTTSSALTAASASQPMGALLGSAAPRDPKYAMQVEVDPRGASVRSVLLNEFKHPADYKLPESKRRPYVFMEPYFDVPDSDPLANRSITLSGPTFPTQTVDLTSVTWNREEATANSVSYSVTIQSADGPIVKLLKRYTVPPKSDRSLGYELQVGYVVHNLSEQAITVKSVVNGPTLPPREQSRGGDRQVMAGYQAGNRSIEVGQHFIEAFKPEQPTIDLTKQNDHPMEWAGTASTYFAAYVLPTAPAPQGATSQAAVPAGLISSVTATEHQVTNPLISPEDRPVTMKFETADIKLAPHGSTETPMHVFLGPRWRSVLDNPYYAAFPRSYDTTLVIRSGPCGFCTFDWLIKAMVILLGAFQWVAGGFAGHGSWGIAIIMLVVIVRTALHPIMKRSQVQMMKMGQMGPELEKLKKKYGDDKDAYAKAQMQFMKEQGFAPVLGCLPMFLQMPIWIALYSALQTTFELRQAPFLWGLTWIRDLSKPDYFINFGHPVAIPILGWIWPNTWHVDGINILPIFMAVVFYLQQKFTPKPPATTPEQQQQQKMMQWMSLLFPVFLYNGPSGLNIYILTSTTIGIVEAKIIRDHMKQQEAAKKEGPVLIDAPPTRGSRRRREEPAAPAKPRGLAGWWAEIQDKLDQERRKKTR